MKSFFDILKIVSNMPWNTFDDEPDSFEYAEQSLKQSISQAHTFIWNLKYFPFKVVKDKIELNNGIREYNAPVGSIVNSHIDGKSSYLQLVDNYDFLSITDKGLPNRFWIDVTNEGNKLCVYPTPDKNYLLNVRFNSFNTARDANGNPKLSLEDADDYLNIPPEWEDIYIKCLQNKAMVYLINDESDENFKPYEKAFLENYATLLNLAGVEVQKFVRV